MIFLTDVCFMLSIVLFCLLYNQVLTWLAFGAISNFTHKFQRWHIDFFKHIWTWVYQFSFYSKVFLMVYIIISNSLLFFHTIDSSIAVLEVDAIIDCESLEQAHVIQQSIIRRFVSCILEKTRDWLDKCVQVVGWRVIHAEDGHSIRLYMHISTVDALHEVRQLFDSGQLKSLVEFFFNLLLTDTHCEPVRVKLLSLVNYCTCDQYFNCGELVAIAVLTLVIRCRCLYVWYVCMCVCMYVCVCVYVCMNFRLRV